MQGEGYFKVTKDAERQNNLDKDGISTDDLCFKGIKNLAKLAYSFEKNGNADSKNDREKIDILKNVISDMVKDEDQKSVIRGDG